MALQAKKLASGAKKVFMSLTTENKIKNVDGFDGGLSSLIIPRQINGEGTATGGKTIVKRKKSVYGYPDACRCREEMREQTFLVWGF